MRTALLVLLVLAASQTWAQSQTTDRLLDSALILQGVDLAQSAHCLGAGSCREANPILRPFADQPLALGATKMGIAVASSVLLRHVAPKRPRLVRWLAVGLVAGYGVIVARNARELRQ